MDTREITNQQALDALVGSQQRSQFLQSWQWGEFQRALPSKIIRLGVFEQGKLVASSQAVERALPLGRRYWYVPRGPIVNNQIPIIKFQAVYKFIIDELASRAAASEVMFIRLEPPMERPGRQIFEKLMQPRQLRPVKFVQPADTIYLDLNNSEEELLAAMHPKTRYNLRLAEKKGVWIRLDGGVDDFDAFWRLMEATAKRDQFQRHSRSYYREMHRLLAPTDFMKMFLAEYRGKVIAANLVVFFGDTASYVHGASANEDREVMAPHLLQWRQIQEAKKRGLRYYDFWGVAPGQSASGETTDSGSAKSVRSVAEKLRTDWLGISRFKRGFGGWEVNYVGAYDLILDRLWYKIYRTVQRLRI